MRRAISASDRSPHLERFVRDAFPFQATPTQRSRKNFDLFSQMLRPELAPPVAARLGNAAEDRIVVGEDQTIAVHPDNMIGIVEAIAVHDERSAFDMPGDVFRS